jgi:hypothetical protein
MSLFDSASLVVTPNGVKEGKLYSIKPTDGSGDLSVTRATTATRVNSAGLVEVVPYNLVTYSNDFTNADWSKNNATVTANSIISPDGTQNASLISSTSTTESGIFKIIDVSGTNTWSFYAKKGTGRYVFLNTNVPLIAAKFDLESGVVVGTPSSGATASIENVGNGWYRCILSSSTSVNRFTIFITNNTTTTDVTSSVGLNFYLYGTQLVQGSSAKDYYPTTTRLNIPRLDYTNGSCPSILVEPQRTNLLTRSEEFNDSSWAVNATITANTAISPDGTQDADTILGTGFIGKNILQSGIHTFSVFAKAGTSNEIRLNVFDGTTDRGVYYNLSNGTITSSYGTIIASNIVSYGNGWYRIIITTNNATRSYVQIHRDSAQTCFIYGAQLEAGSYPTSYIPTTSASVTRNADEISKTGISSLIGQTEGTVFLDWKQNGLSNLQGIYANNYNLTGSISIQVDTSGRLRAFVLNNGSFFDLSTPYNTIQVGQSYKVAFAYKSGSLALYLNGNQIQTSTNTFSFTTTLSEIDLSNRNIYFAQTCETSVKTTAIWKTRLSNDTLATLTTI